MVKNLPSVLKTLVPSWVRIPWRREWLLTAMFLPGGTHLSWGAWQATTHKTCKEIGHHWWLCSFHFSHFIYPSGCQLQPICLSETHLITTTLTTVSSKLPTAHRGLTSFPAVSLASVISAPQLSSGNKGSFETLPELPAEEKNHSVKEKLLFDIHGIKPQSLPQPTWPNVGDSISLYRANPHRHPVPLDLHFTFSRLRIPSTKTFSVSSPSIQVLVQICT